MKSLLLAPLFLVISNNNEKNTNSTNNNSGYLVRVNCYENNQLAFSYITNNFKTEAYRTLCNRRENSRFEIVKLK